MAFRFVHTADLHLDSPLRSLALRDPDLAELIADASRSTLRRIIDLCLAEQVDALLIAGDLYDGSQTSMKTARYLAAELARLDQAGIRAFILRGNHDAESHITRELTLPPSAHVFASRAEVVTLDGAQQRIALHGLSFRDRHAPESLLPKYRAPLPDALNIGVMHTSLGGAPGHDPYAPCALADLQATGFDYWALGHIHKRTVHPGPMPVVMPGIPQGRDAGEPGAGSVTLVTCSAGGVTLEERVTALAAFQPVTVDVTGLEDRHEMRERIAQALDAQRPAVPHLVARLTLRGATPLASALLRDRDLALAEAQETARSLGHTWVEALRLDLGRPAPEAGALADLHRLIAQDVLPSAAFQAAFERIRADLQAALPDRDSRDAVADLSPEALEQGLAEALARLAGGR
ncbi:MAG: metallophosphoesterase family protein [Roseinatronobacter sp.]